MIRFKFRSWWALWQVRGTVPGVLDLKTRPQNPEHTSGEDRHQTFLLQGSPLHRGEAAVSFSSGGARSGVTAQGSLPVGGVDEEAWL